MLKYNLLKSNMDLTKTKLYQTIINSSTSAAELWNACNDYIVSKKDLNLRDSASGVTFLHLLSGNGGLTCTAPGVASVYLMASSGMNLNARDCTGETCLHKAARTPESYRVVIALMRCGVDPLTRNDKGQLAEDVLTECQPSNWKQTLHWLNKYSPGLYHTLSQEKVDVVAVEKLLRGWCRTNFIREDGKEIELSSDMTVSESLRKTLTSYSKTNEFVISLLSGKSSILTDDEFSDIDINTKDHLHEGEGRGPPTVPKPLLACIWEMRLESCVEALLSLGVDSSVLYTPSGDKDKREPLFFHLLSHPDDRNHRTTDAIVHKILLASNMAARDLRGQTVLFKAIECDYSDLFVKALFKYGVNISSRDEKGRTARDYAESLKKYKYLTVIDNYVVDLAKACKFEKLQNLVIRGYDHIHNITDTRGINMINILKQHYIKGNKNRLLAFIDKIPAIQEHLHLLFRATDTGGTEELQRYISRKFSAAQDRCGRTVLHKAILNKKKDMIKLIATHYPDILDMQDNLGRTALHYSLLVTEGPSLFNYLVFQGARPDIRDWAGRLPEEYSVSYCGKDEYLRLQLAMKNFSMDVYLAETNFEKALNRAVRRGEIVEVERLVLGLGDKGDINRYANVLFQCVDTRRQEIAAYLISRGMRTDIYRQYEECSSNSSACSSYTCDHTLTSLYARAKRKECWNILEAITENSKSINSFEMDGRPIVSKPSTMDQLTLLGLV